MTMTSLTPTLNSVASIKATSERGVFILHCNITDVEGNTYEADYCSRPDDTFGLNPTIRQWLTDNPFFPVQPRAPATVREIRATLPPLTARQFRLGLVSSGFTLAEAASVIEAMPEGPAKETVKIEWECATTFSRMHSLVANVSGELGITDEQLDTMWLAAIDL